MSNEIPDWTKKGLDPKPYEIIFCNFCITPGEGQGGFFCSQHPLSPTSTRIGNFDGRGVAFGPSIVDCPNSRPKVKK